MKTEPCVPDGAIIVSEIHLVRYILPEAESDESSRLGMVLSDDMSLLDAYGMLAMGQGSLTAMLGVGDD